MARVIIDGYNLLPVTLLKDRETLIAKLREYKKLKNHDITVVFDGTHNGTGMGDRYHDGGVEVIFTPLTITADDYIIDEILDIVAGANTIIVSTDRKIQKAAAARSVQSMDSQEFAPKLLGRSRTPSRDQDDDGPREKRGNPKKLSKKERARLRSMKKL